MLTYSVGQNLGPKPREGMQVTPGPHGLNIEVFCRKDSDLARCIAAGGPFQFAFIDANPFCWFLMNAGPAGYLDACWSRSRVPLHVQDVMQGSFHTMRESSAREPAAEDVAAVLLLAELSGTVFGVRPIHLPNSAWNLLATTILKHPTALGEKEILKHQERLERRYARLDDFRRANIKWVKNVNRSISDESANFI